MDLNKAFDCLVHDFLIAKLEAYGFIYESLKPINSYLTNRKHRTKINSSFWVDSHLIYIYIYIHINIYIYIYIYIYTHIYK